MSDGRKFEFNWPFFGNRHIIEFLQGSILNQRVSHFYIFAGIEDLGKGKLAQHFAASLLCNNFWEGKGGLPCGECGNCRQAVKGSHSDITVQRRLDDKQNISIEQIRGFIRLMNLGAFNSRYKIGIIKDAASLSLEAANALLKTLEEPKPGVVIILLARSLDQLPPTIVSRGQILLFRPAAREQIYDYLVNEHQASRHQAKTIARISAGRPALAAKLLGNPEFFSEREKIIHGCLKILASSPGERLRLAGELTANSGEAVAARAKAAGILAIWQTVIRDLLLLSFPIEEFVANEVALDELKQIKLPLNKLLSARQALEQGLKHIAANVNPRLVLENVSLQI
ncbi:hypothetical protein COU01_02730 [Candidatus Falkowbacteria bacterium CG10_big_fil_rev_8_21_14_0_10_44_15]|uniref:DNA-directed DNA polymerase n=1 Tax=Candidatus Falkowbacteria bacterium CG10_big_fil_rev_8_21_14_0_10_44_15 TaxID=1974569 RepID=A0A2H0UZL4_9BACT|nr:MAG: hypothetical protein COU01_02730 [Candidatus Falkowbacteria bacterium CG10_big_fil_rev_8_21_14_0_10_44_15]